MRTEEGGRLEHQPELPLGSVTVASRPAAAHDWRLDEGTCRVGRAGVAAARAMLGDRVDGRRSGSNASGQGTAPGHDQEDVAA